MLTRTQRGERRLTPPMHKLLLIAHIVASVGWLGITTAKLTLLVAVARSVDRQFVQALLTATAVVDWAFPPAALLTLLTGILLGLVTRWGIVQYTWVLAKLALTIAVPITAVRIGAGLLLNAQAGGSVAPLHWLAVAHVLMLLTATVLSVYKPWGKSWFGRWGKAHGGLEVSAPVR